MSRCAATRRRWRCVASPWPSWATWNAPAPCAAARSARSRSWRARCELAEADVALAMRDPDWPDETLESTRQALLRHGDLANAAHARLLHARRLLLGRADDAAVAIAGWDQAPLPAAARAVHALAAAGIALRRLQAEPARLALAQARRRARIRYRRAASRGRCAVAPAGGPGGQADPPRRAAPARLDEVEALMASDALVADTARQALRSPMATVDLSRRPVLRWRASWPRPWPATARGADRRRPGGPTRPIAPGWGGAGRLRVALRAWPRSGQPPGLCAGPATRLRSRDAGPARRKRPPGTASPAGGRPALVSAAGSGAGRQPTLVQPETPAAAGQAQPLGQGRARRWAAPPPPGCATVLLLLPLPPAD